MLYLLKLGGCASLCCSFIQDHCLASIESHRFGKITPWLSTRQIPKHRSLFPKALRCHKCLELLGLHAFESLLFRQFLLFSPSHQFSLELLIGFHLSNSTLGRHHFYQVVPQLNSHLILTFLGIGVDKGRIATIYLVHLLI